MTSNQVDTASSVAAPTMSIINGSTVEGSSSSSSSSHSTLPRPPLTILYASATGTASDLAHRLSRLAQQHHYLPSIHSLSSSPDLPSLRSLLNRSPGPVVFLIATAGNGSFPTAAESLWQDLLSARYNTGEELKGVRFAIFGLGDSSYPRFCWPERMLRKRLVDLGGVELIRGEGDEQHYLGIEGTFQPFLTELFFTLDAEHPLPQGMQVLPDDAILPPIVELRFLDEEDETHGNGTLDPVRREQSVHSHSADGSTEDPSALVSPSSSSSSIRWLRLVKNDRLTAPGHWQDVRQLELTLPESDPVDLRYDAGDIATLRPANDPVMVDALIARLGWSQHSDRPVALFHRDGQRIHLPPLQASSLIREEPLTLRSYLIHHTSPFSPLRPSLFPLLRPFSPKGHMEREKLDEFCTPGDGYDEAMEYGVRTRRTIAEVLEEFQSVSFEPRWAAEVFSDGTEEGQGGMREREFSIASGPSESPRSLMLLIALVSYRTRIRQPRIGVLSRWIASLQASSSPTSNLLIPVRIKRSSLLKLPSSGEQTPIIGIGPGTGMAPIRGLVRERISRARLRKSQSQGAAAADAAAAAAEVSLYKPFGPILLFFGCRSFPKEDALLHEEWSELARQCRVEGLGKIHVRWASSRVDPCTARPRPKGEKQYVQDLIDEWDHPLPPAFLLDDDDPSATQTETEMETETDTSSSQGTLLWHWLTCTGATVYLCGSSGNMPRQVRRSFERLVENFGGLESDQAERFLDRLETNGRWREECWS